MEVLAADLVEEFDPPFDGQNSTGCQNRDHSYLSRQSDRTGAKYARDLLLLWLLQLQSALLFCLWFFYRAALAQHQS